MKKFLLTALIVTFAVLGAQSYDVTASVDKGVVINELPHQH